MAGRIRQDFTAGHSAAAPPGRENTSSALERASARAHAATAAISADPNAGLNAHTEGARLHMKAAAEAQDVGNHALAARHIDAASQHITHGRSAAHMAGLPSHESAEDTLHHLAQSHGVELGPPPSSRAAVHATPHGTSGTTSPHDHAMASAQRRTPEQAMAEPHALQHGKKGGSYYVSPSGAKVYTKK